MATRDKTRLWLKLRDASLNIYLLFLLILFVCFENGLQRTSTMYYPATRKLAETSVSSLEDPWIHPASLPRQNYRPAKPNHWHAAKTLHKTLVGGPEQNLDVFFPR
jgi:hypothetical protein